MSRKRSFPTVTDMFCGAGGSSSGAKKAGATIEQVQVMLGHASPQVTSHYIGEGVNLDDHAVDYHPVSLKLAA